MTQLWFIWLLLHQAYTLVPIITVQLGEPVTLTCFPENLKVVTWVYWYKQSAGNTLELIAKVHKSKNQIYEHGFQRSRFKITYNGNKGTLTILSSAEQDEGMYHCGFMDWSEFTWAGTYLSVRGNSQRVSSYTVVHEPTVSDRAHPTNLETLQCSILSESDNTTCSGEPSVFWFRAISDTSYPEIVYNEGIKQENCEKTSNNQKKCSFGFSKNINSSVSYYCAVATCGEILFGNAANMKNQDKMSINSSIVLMIIIISLAISVTLNIIYFWYRTKRSTCTRLNESSPSQPNPGDLSQEINESENGLDLDYAALHFSRGKEQKSKKKREQKTEESVYSQVIFNSNK
ncbi:uncharacterized protein LOC119798102 [Cyprinodon tularosa]|uniref:uncharacterized protein LOC119798102 n=1 Tax=Cyprinodon tularosa TaxID=77115 RepID=UPI0018E1E364|nr:uncharacterized protein LOC119798102 [Cyprinodon tularosa]